MARKTRTTTLVWLRRAMQTAFLLLFLYLFLETAYQPHQPRGRRGEALLPTRSAGDADGLAGVARAGRGHAAFAGYVGRHLPVRPLVLRMDLPFGTVHQLFSSLRGGTVKTRLDTGGYGRWHKVKYYVLVVFLAGALLGVNVVGWLDPISFFFRGMAVAVYPALNSAADSMLVNDSLRRHLLAVEQPHYFGNVLIGVLFGVVIALNFYRARFWCGIFVRSGAARNRRQEPAGAAP